MWLLLVCPTRRKVQRAVPQTLLDDASSQIPVHISALPIIDIQQAGQGTSCGLGNLIGQNCRALYFCVPIYNW